MKISKRSIWSLIGLVILGVFTWFQTVGYLIPGFQEISSLNPKTIRITNLNLILVPIITYALAATMICLAVNIFKKVTKLKICKKDYDLILGFMSVFFCGFVFDVIFALANVIIFASGNFLLALLKNLIWMFIIFFIVAFLETGDDVPN